MRLDGTTVLVTGDAALGARIAAGLEEFGAHPGLASDTARTREEAVDAFATAASELGGLDAVVHVAELGPIEDILLSDTDEDAWAARAEEPIWTALLSFQAAHATFAGRPGSIVAAVPSIALTGAAGLVAPASAAEGIRQLVKSAARAWGADGVRVNALTLPVEDWGFVPPAAHVVPNRYGASLPGPNADADLAGAVAVLLGPVARGITGTTVGVDRGTVLAP